MGPLQGIKVVEFCGIGPGPMCAMLLADMGATVLRIDRADPGDFGIKRPARFKFTNRGRKSIALDLKAPEDLALALDLVERADAVMEGFRPGVAERLGFGPEECLKRNPRVVYGRMTGWGQTGPLARIAGHDLNYIAITGAADAIGRNGQPPTPPLNLVGDFGGGSLYLAMGMLAALLEQQRSGKGQVVDAAITEGTLSLMTAHFGQHAAGEVNIERGTNMLDSGSPFYDAYECADGRYVSVAAIENKFYRTMLGVLGLNPDDLPPQMDRKGWPILRKAIGERIRTRTRDEWCAAMDGLDACFAPILTIEEVEGHPHIKAREAMVNIGGVMQPAPAPRFSRTVPDMPTPPEEVGVSAREALAEWGIPADAIAAWEKRQGGAR
ncbi:MAG: CoA transferase [Rhodobiaceae bacterium]|nr:CoA transferase [Rhodobiaceae bacterium]MCC0056238.1 CoA transferase [Rhodobiaceae bacterium]